MPRTSGRSSLTTTAPIRRSPNERNELRCCLVPPMRDLVWVTFSCAMSAPRSARACRGAGGRRASAQHGRRSHILDRQPALGRDLLGPGQALERGDGRVHHVARVGGPERPGQHVVHAGALEHGTHGAAGDDTGTWAGGLEQHHPSRGLALHGVRDRAADAGNPEEVLLGRLDALGDRRGHLLGLAVADADHAVAVAHYHQGGEAEPPSALDDLGDPVDGHDSLEICGALVGPATAVVTALPPLSATASTPRCCHQKSLSVLARWEVPPEPPVGLAWADAPPRPSV